MDSSRRLKAPFYVWSCAFSHICLEILWYMKDLKMKISLEKFHWEHEVQVTDFSLLSRNKLTKSKNDIHSFLCFSSENRMADRSFLQQSTVFLLTSTDFCINGFMWVHYLYIFHIKISVFCMFFYQTKSVETI